MVTGDLTSMLRRGLLESREHHLKVTRAFEGERLLGPKLAIVNPPLWEIGHVGWFQERWCLRHRPDRTLADSILPGADALYDSSAVAHATRWDLPLPDLAATRRYLDEVLGLVLARLEEQPDNERLRYFVKLCTLHEDMHSEAFHYTHQTHGYAAPFDGDAGAEAADLDFAGGALRMGAEKQGAGFIFDNEKWAHDVQRGSAGQQRAIPRIRRGRGDGAALLEEARGALGRTPLRPLGPARAAGAGAPCQLARGAGVVRMGATAAA
jgi:gamma-glutamyl hercynylcysteine S-oxide synthase